MTVSKIVLNDHLDALKNVYHLPALDQTDFVWYFIQGFQYNKDGLALNL